MYALAMAVLGAMLFSWQVAATQPQQAASFALMRAKVAAANFWAYRSAVVAYVALNPSASGTIPDTSLSFPAGYIRDPDWTNDVSGGTLYTYSTAALPPNTVAQIAAYGGRTLVIGVAQANDTMTSASGGANGFTLPSVIPTGAVVVVGD